MCNLQVVLTGYTEGQFFINESGLLYCKQVSCQGKNETAPRPSISSVSSVSRIDLPLIARVAKDSGLVVHVTTGITEGFEFHLLKKLAPSIASLHFGINHERLLAQPKKELATLRQLVQAAQTLGIESGANLILCNNVLAHFNQIIDILSQAGFNRVILLRYKPPADLNRWLVEKPSPEKYFGFEAVLRETVKKYPQVNFRLDCALSFLQRHQNTVDAAFAEASLLIIVLLHMNF